MRIEVKGKWGRQIVSGDPMTWYGQVSASKVNQVLMAIQPRLQQVFGNYTWTLQGYTGDYWIEAKYPGGVFIEGRGPTPRLALANWVPVRLMLGSDD